MLTSVIPIRDIERLVRRLGRLRSPDHHVCDKVSICSLPDERRDRLESRTVQIASFGSHNTNNPVNEYPTLLWI
jgi:hypothetical protein